jgi:hypothetical protein
MEESQDLTEIADKLSNEYEVDLERARASVLKLLEDLEKDGLIMSNGKGD